LLVIGRVQGVGFRPFVYRLACQHQLIGWVKNIGGEVDILAQGKTSNVEHFVADLIQQAPPLAQPRIQSQRTVACEHLDAFTILSSTAQDDAQIHVPPDYFTCADCLAELRDPQDRRHHYPFINCTQCGPRYTLIRSLPYDRPATTMADFPLCSKCAEEYENPLDRRFHAQPLACPTCGPRLEFKTKQPDSKCLEGESAIQAAITALKQGKILAVKGIGGYHLMCDANNTDSIQRLRELKPRPHKPLAVMFGDDKRGLARYGVALSSAQHAFLASPLRPILLAPWPAQQFASQLAPALNELGVMLPYSPLHHLLLEQFGQALVATSANISGEPVLTDNDAVEQRLNHVADAFLHHNRPIARPADDPVFRWIAAKPRPLRLGRGCAPLELDLPYALPHPVLAVGGHLKNTIALAWDSRVVVSPHIGELDSPRGLAVFQQVLENLQQLYHVQAETVLCDAHPGYASTRWASHSGLPVHKVWHHHAHASALAGEFPDIKNWLIFTWDGVGLGPDGTAWGGDGLLGSPANWRAVAGWRPFYLPGGDKAGREPWRSAAALCWEAAIDWSLPAEIDADMLYHAWQKRLNCPQSHAVGRLFDAAAALLGVCSRASFEGQGAMYLEALADRQATPLDLPLRQTAAGIWETDWEPLIRHLLTMTARAHDAAALFHASLAQALVKQAQSIAATHQVDAIGLSGGVFQNKVLCECVVGDLLALGFDVRVAEKIPLNDAGLSFGQVIEFANF
jgi:hydrogenase maturation protein HypF